MKLLLSCLLFSVSGLLAHAAGTPVITVDAAGHVLLDGANAGQPADVLVNHPQYAPAVNAALLAFHAKVQADATAATKATADDAAAKIAAAEARATAAEAKVAAAEAKVAAAEAKVKAIVDSLKPLASVLPDPAKLALQDDAARERAALEAQKTALDAKLAALPK